MLQTRWHWCITWHKSSTFHSAKVGTSVQHTETYKIRFTLSAVKHQSAKTTQTFLRSGHSSSMVYYLDFKMIKDSIASARSAIDTINYWKRILPLYFPVEEGFDLIHQCNREDVLILRLPCLQQSPDLRQQDVQCVIMISAEDKDRPACKDKESYAYACLMDLDPDSHDRKAFGINASGSHFSLFKITGNKHNSLIPISNLEEMTVGRVLESKFDAIHKEAYEGQCKVIIQSANNIYITAHLDDSFTAFTMKRRTDALPMTTSTITTAVRHKFFKAEYEGTREKRW